VNVNRAVERNRITTPFQRQRVMKTVAQASEALLKSQSIGWSVGQ